MSFLFLEGLTPDPDALLNEISPHISDDVLHFIAHADYGYDADENFHKLKQIRDGGAIAQPLPWSPREVLELTRWSNPAGKDWLQQPDGIDRPTGHLAVVFSCAVLMRAYGDAKTREYCDGYNQTLIQLLGNLEHADFDTARANISFLVWLIAQLEAETDERVFVAVALLFLAVKYEAKLSDEQLLAFSRWIIGQEKKVVEFWDGGIGDQHYHWLLRMTHFNAHHKKWIALGVEMSALPLLGEAGDVVREIGRCLAGEDWEPTLHLE